MPDTTRKRPCKPRLCPEAVSVGDVLRTVLGRSRSGRDLELAELWRHWDQVLGPRLAGLALPLGRRGSLLLLAAEDNLILQELSFLAPEILERVNAFLDEPLFTDTRLCLLGKQRPLNLAADSTAGPLERPRRPQLPASPDPDRLGALWDDLDPETPLGRCYRAYVRRFGRKNLP